MKDVITNKSFARHMILGIHKADWLQAVTRIAAAMVIAAAILATGL